ncbi:S8 family serine peptidase [bacterium]|nr:S8 family serine peptidase [bacterium]
MRRLLPATFFCLPLLLGLPAGTVGGAVRGGDLAHDLGTPTRVAPPRTEADRALTLSLAPHRNRLTAGAAGLKATRPDLVDVDLTDQTKGVGKASRPVHHLSPTLMAQVQHLTDPHFLRRHLADATASPAVVPPRLDGPVAPRRAAKSPPWTADQKLANPTDMNDEYVSVAAVPGTGTLYAVFAAKDLGGTDRDIHIARSTDDGATWQVWEMPSFLEDEYHPEIAIDGGGYLHVTWVRADGYILRSRTTNPDAPTQWAWVKGLAVGEPCATPSIAVSGAGDFAKVFIAAGWLTINYDYLAYEWTLVFMASSNGGNSVTYDWFLPDGYADYWPDVAMSGGTVHFINAEVDAYTGETEILIATDAYTGSFSDPASMTGWTSNNAGFPRLACQGSDVFTVFQLDWSDGIGSDGDIIYLYSWDSGASWFGPYGLVADEYDSVGPAIFTRDGVVGAVWLDAPPGGDEFELASRLGSGYGQVAFFGDVELVTEQPRVEPQFHSADGLVGTDLIHAAWIDRRDYPTEGHNVYTSRHALAPNLAPFTPADWDTALVANMIRGARSDGYVAAGDTAWVSFAFLNDGLADATDAFFIDLEIDGQPAASWVLEGGLATGTYVPLEDFPVVLPAGDHTLRLVLDPENDLAESDESDNVLARTFRWRTGEPELRFHPTAVVTAIVPETKRADALLLAAQPLTRREVQLPVVAPELAAALDVAKADEMLRVMVVPAERLDPTAMAAALKGASRATRREVIAAAARHQLDTAHQRLAADLTDLAKSGQAGAAEPLWLAGALLVPLTPSGVQRLAAHPEVGRMWLDDHKNEVWARPSPEPAAQTAAKALAWHLTTIGANQAWAAGLTGAGVLVGHLDTGLIYDHPDLANHLWDGGAAYPNHGWDAVDDDNDPYDGNAPYFHGTHTGGLIVGDGTNGTTTGAAPGATLMVLRTVPGYFADMVEGLQFGLDNGVQIFTMSAGWSLPPDDVRVANRYNAELLLSIDVPWVCAAGNGDNTGGHYALPDDIGSPGDCPNPWYAPNGGAAAVITVGAVDSAWQVGPTSSRGPTEWNTANPHGDTPYDDYPYPPGLMKPDLAAPGVSVTSTTGLDGYVAYDGTSMACPLVTAAFCLALEKTPGLTPAQLAETFETTAHDLTAAPAASGRDNATGAGLIAIPAALDYVPASAPLGVQITNYGELPLVFGAVYAPAAWLQVAGVPAWLDPGASATVQVLIDPAGLAEGTYESDVIFMTNDPHGASVLPVTLLYGQQVTPTPDEVPGLAAGTLRAAPNPFNPRTTIRFVTARSGPVRLDIHDVRGARVRRLVAGSLAAGDHDVTWDGCDDAGRGLASGTYFARLAAPGSPDAVRKLTLVR